MSKIPKYGALFVLSARIVVRKAMQIPMDDPFDQLSATALRKLLITEVKTFVACLETTPHERLQEMRNRLIVIYKTLSEKEQLEMLPLVWGRNSTSQQTDTEELRPVDDPMEILPAPIENGSADAEPS